MSELYACIYRLVCRIPSGCVATYGQIAALSGDARRARVVGYALNACSDPSIPCHRVVNRMGGLSDAFSPLGKESHRMLLAMEGVSFLPSGNVDLEHCRWRDEESEN